MPFPQLDIIIVNYNSTSHLLNCLNSIKVNNGFTGINVYVEDNGSKDDPERIIRMYPEVHLTLHNVNLGFAKAANSGIRRSSSPYVMLLNPDTLIQPGAIESLVGFMENNPTIGVTGPKILNTDGSVQGSARAFPTPLTALFGRSSVLTRMFPNNPITRANILTFKCNGRHPMKVDWVSGACMVVRRKAISQVGMFDERFFMYWEDADWCRRMWDKGWRVVYYPNAEVVHYVGVSSEQRIARSVLEFHKSSYLLFGKYTRFPSGFKPAIIAALAFRLFVVLAFGAIRVFMAKNKKSDTAESPLPFKSTPDNGKIRILRLIARLNIGGPAIHVHLLTKGLDHRRFESRLVTGKISAKEGDMSYLFKDITAKPICIPELQREIKLWMDFMAVLRIFKLVREYQPHIVHTHTAKAGTSARIALTMYYLLCKKRVKMVHTFHGHVFEGYFGRIRSVFFIWIERLLSRVTDVIIAISNSQKKALVNKFRIAPKNKIKVIELGFELTPFLNNQNRKGWFRNKFGIDNNIKLIGIIGRLVSIKNHIMFLEGARLFLERYPSEKVLFIIVGDGELREELEKYCKDNNILKQVLFLGWIKDVASIYADLDVLALTSLNEGTPVSIIEAMASSVPIISTDAGGVLDLLGPPESTPPKNGFLVCERGVLCRRSDPIGFARGLDCLLKGDANSNGSRVKSAKMFVRERYTQQRLFKDLESLYSELISHNPAL